MTLTTGRYEGYEMTPAEHVKSAEKLVRSAENYIAESLFQPAGILASVAQAHVAVAQAQMIGQARA